MKKQFYTFIAVIIAFAVFSQVNVFAQKVTKAKDVLLFEISKYSASGGFRASSTEVLFIYKSGRIACQSSRL